MRPATCIQPLLIGGRTQTVVQCGYLLNGVTAPNTLTNLFFIPLNPFAHGMDADLVLVRQFRNAIWFYHQMVFGAAMATDLFHDIKLN